MQIQNLPTHLIAIAEKHAKRNQKKYPVSKDRMNHLARKRRERLRQENLAQAQLIKERREKEKLEREKRLGETPFLKYVRSPEFLNWYESVNGYPWNTNFNEYPHVAIEFIEDAKQYEEEEARKRAREEWLRGDGLYELDHPERYRRKVIMATPQWANMAKIREIYRERDMLNTEGNEKYHVDHIIPIQGEYVCGLHVEYNLRVITATENIRKKNNLVDIA